MKGENQTVDEEGRLVLIAMLVYLLSPLYRPMTFTRNNLT